MVFLLLKLRVGLLHSCSNILNASMNFGAVRDFFVEFVLLGFSLRS